MKPKNLFNGLMAFGLATALTIGASFLSQKVSAQPPEPKPPRVEISRRIEIKFESKKDVYIQTYDDLSKVTNKDGVQLFSDYIISKIRTKNIPLDFINDYLSIKEKEYPLFGGIKIIDAWEAGMPFQYAERLSGITNKEGDCLISPYWMIESYKHKVPIDYAKGLAKVLHENDIKHFGGPLSIYFTGPMIISAHNCGLELDYTENSLAIKDKENNSVFTLDDILYLKKGGATVKHMNYLASIRDEDGDLIDRKKLFMFSLLDLTKEEIFGFKDTNKPNALVIYPTHDWNHAFARRAAIQLFKRIKENYDTKVIIAEKEQEVYKAIDTMQNIELLVLGGHGSPITLSLGERDLRLEKAEKTEDYTFDIFDIELAKYLRKLDPNAVIFLNSCSNARGKEFAMNLANFVIDNSSGQQKIIASTKPFAEREIIVKSIYPFDITIKEEESGEDLTYTHTKHSIKEKFVPFSYSLGLFDFNKGLIKYTPPKK